MWDGCGGSMPKRGQEMICNRVSHRCLLRRLHHERSRGHQMVPREPSDIARIGMLGAKRELLLGRRPEASTHKTRRMRLHRVLCYCLSLGSLSDSSGSPVRKGAQRFPGDEGHIQSMPWGREESQGGHCTHAERDSAARRCLSLCRLLAWRVCPSS